MKRHLFASIGAAVLALSWPVVGQVATPTNAAPAGNTGLATVTVPDGIVFYNGKPYLIRNGRASLIDATLVPNGQILTNDGRLVPIPMTYTGFSQGTQALTPGAAPVNPVPLTPAERRALESPAARDNDITTQPGSKARIDNDITTNPGKKDPADPDITKKSGK